MRVKISLALVNLSLTQSRLTEMSYINEDEVDATFLSASEVGIVKEVLLDKGKSKG